MKDFLLKTLLIITLFLSCKESNTKIKTIKNDNDQISVLKSSVKKVDLKVSAYFIYDDGTLSTFDILNDKTIALWNVIAEGRNALQPSHQTKIKFSGEMDSLTLNIKNGRKLVIDTTILHLINQTEYVIKNTGCSEVYIKALKNKKIVYNDTIPFHCGE